MTQSPTIDFDNAEQYIKYHAKGIASKAQFGSEIFSYEDLVSAGREKYFEMLDFGALYTNKEGAIKLRLRGEMIDALRKFTNYNRQTKTSPTYVPEEKLNDNLEFSRESDSVSNFNDMLEGLTPREKETIYLMFHDGWTLTEIAEKANVSVAAIFQAQKRAFKKIRAAFKNPIDI